MGLKVLCLGLHRSCTVFCALDMNVKQDLIFVVFVGVLNILESRLPALQYGGRNR